MINPIQAIGDYDGDDIMSLLKKMQLFEIFQPLTLSFQDHDVLLSVIKYIVFAYSLDSEYIPVKSEWGEIKKRIFEYVELDKKWYKNVVEVDSEAVRDSIINWLNYQDNETYSEMMLQKDLCLQFQQSLYMSTEAVTYDQKKKNAGYIQEVNERIIVLRNELTQNNDKLKAGVQEVRAKRKNGHTIGLEKFAIKKTYD